MRCLLIVATLVMTHGSILWARERRDDSKLEFEKHVKPVLVQLCFRCHGQETQEAGLRIDTLSIDLVNSGAGDKWEEVLNQLNLGAMPPEDEAQPSADQRELITSWIHSELEYAAEVRRASGDGSSLRRMTGYEHAGLAGHRPRFFKRPSA